MGIQLGKKINGGGTGAIHEGPDDTVYKITTGDTMANRDIMREFMLLSRVDKVPGLNVQQALDAGKDDQGRCYIQFRKIHGESLGDLMQRNALSQDDVRSIRLQTREIFEGLAENGFYHGDAKAISNYMITRGPEGPKVTLVDFVDGGIDPTGKTAREEWKSIDAILRRLLKDPGEDLDADFEWSPA